MARCKFDEAVTQSLREIGSRLEDVMIKTIFAGAALAGVFAVATMAPATPARANPNCNCTWMATGFNESSGEFTYEWVCPTLPDCVDIKTPEG